MHLSESSIRRVVALFLSAGLLAACSNGAPSSSTSSESKAASGETAQSTTASTATATQAASSTNIEFTDLTGAKITLKEPPKRIVTIPIPAASMVVAVDGTAEHLVGMNKASKTAIEQGFLGEVYPELKEVNSEVAGTDFSPNMESILSTHPDLVIQWGDQTTAVVEPIQHSGVPVAQILYGTQERIEAIAKMYGELLGKEDRAKRIVDTMHERRAKIEAKGKAQKPDGSQPTAIYINSDKDGYTVNGVKSYNHFSIELAGAKSLAPEAQGSKVSVNPEQILEWNPDFIFIGNFGPAMPKDIYNDSRLAGVKAVKNKQVYKVPLGGYRWDPPSQESPLMWEWMSTLLRGETNKGFRKTIADDYEFLYNKRPTDEQLDKILWLEANKDSENYAQFGQ